MSANLISWPANPGTDNVSNYQVWGAAGHDVAFSSCSMLANVGTATSYLHSGISTGAEWTYYIVAQNAVGSSAPSAYVDIVNGSTLQVNSAALDAAFGSTQGDILYRGASVWTVLAPGTAGNVLTTGGASANPYWAAASGGGSYTAGAGIQISGGTISIGALGGDLSNTAGSAAVTVVALQGRTVASGAPATNQALVWNGSAWTPTTLSGGGGPVQQSWIGTWIGGDF